MAFYKWLQTGELDWSDGDTLTAADLNGSIDEVMCPIGSVIAWLKSFTSVPATLPTGWVECDGSAISDADSPLNGETLPDLDGGEFLRGAATSGGTGGSETHSHGSGESGQGFTGDNDKITDVENHLPPYYEVVWIMRIK